MVVSTLGHALTGLLLREPATGYDLARQLRRPVGYFWSAGHTQIYPELARLEEAGLVRHTVIPGAGPRQTKRYRATATGRRELTEWLLATTADVEDREVLLRAYLLFVLPPPSASQVVRALRAHHEQTLAHYLTIRFAPDAGGWGPDVTEKLTWEWGVTFERGRIAWCEALLERIKNSATAAAQNAAPTPPSNPSAP